MKLPVVAEKFIKYVKIDTQSREELSDKVPSTEKQRSGAGIISGIKRKWEQVRCVMMRNTAMSMQ